MPADVSFPCLRRDVATVCDEMSHESPGSGPCFIFLRSVMTAIPSRVTAATDGLPLSPTLPYFPSFLPSFLPFVNSYLHTAICVGAG